MNRIYQVIWSKTKHMYIVVSEIARHNGKSKTSVNESGSARQLLTQWKKGGQTAAAALAVIATIGFCAPGTVYAENPSTDTSTKVDIGNGGTIEYTDRGDVVAGKDNKMPDDNSSKNNVVVGTNNDARHVTKDENGKEVGQTLGGSGTNVIDENGNNVTEASPKGIENAVVTGNGARAEADGDIASGNRAHVINTPKDFYVDKDGNATSNKSDAAYYKDVDGNPTTEIQQYRTGVDANGNPTGELSSDKQYKHAVEETVTVTDDQGNVVSTETKTVYYVDTNDKGAVAVPATSTKDENGNTVTVSRAAEIGDPSENYLQNDQPMYTQTLYVPSTDAIAQGTNAEVNGPNGIAQGKDSKASANGVAQGEKASAGVNAVATGTGASAEENGVAQGPGAKAGQNAVASGHSANAASNSQAIGNGANASASHSTAIGDSSSATVSGSVALGDGAVANRGAKNYGWDPVTKEQANADTKGTDPVWYSNRGAVSVGKSDADGNPIETRQITNVAAGTNDSDAVNVAQLKTAVTAAESHYYSNFAGA